MPDASDGQVMPLRCGMGLFDGTPLERPVTCERCDKPVDECDCPRDAGGAVRLPGDQDVRVRREKRRGKWVTVATGFDAAASDVPGLLKNLQRALGVGGTTKGDGFELQGDARDRVVTELQKLGYAVKPAGG
jgi:translation initiation factor 1